MFGWLQGGVYLHPRRSQEVRRILELQNGVLRALEDAWMTTFRLRHFPFKFGCFLCSVGSCRAGRGRSGKVEGYLRRCREGQSSIIVALEHLGIRNALRVSRR